MRAFLIFNPGSKSGKSAKRLSFIKQCLGENQISFDYKVTTCLADAYTFSAEANALGYDVIIAAGGDGTINQALNGFFNDKGYRVSNSKFAVIYTGTSPDFCKSYHIPLNTRQAVNAIVRGSVKKIKIGCIQYFENDIITSVKYFACCANIGLGADLATMANSGIRKYLGDTAGTFLSLLSILPRFRAANVTATIDGVSVSLPQLFNLSVGITPLIASGIKVNDAPAFDDKRFYLLKASKLSLLNAPMLFYKIYSGKKFNNTNYLSLDYCSQINFDAKQQKLAVEFDGDAAGYTPIRINLAPDCLEIITL